MQKLLLNILKGIMFLLSLGFLCASIVLKTMFPAAIALILAFILSRLVRH